ncbi:hypothetical protein BAUCODRAFT_361780 [Baudoinia panamericana UAMH 10762]|uniref:Uncharacterized protein n=1 Tax=Baudoinia panamericana (strain UAMH 10762) TaxID=717646 RepID=M2N7K2_BAUPA|nr:uncharacterized protein BAUCODRAFT_361780 [Baudoinia panamericana UAMH 10762]EMD00069.1 hypothetical protein BAUCODRAFT_361780 [Baudoinia panamericana UAMH 10762]
MSEEDDAGEAYAEHHYDDYGDNDHISIEEFNETPLLFDHNTQHDHVGGPERAEAASETRHASVDQSIEDQDSYEYSDRYADANGYHGAYGHGETFDGGDCADVVGADTAGPIAVEPRRKPGRPRKRASPNGIQKRTAQPKRPAPGRSYLSSATLARFDELRGLQNSQRPTTESTDNALEPHVDVDDAPSEGDDGLAAALRRQAAAQHYWQSTKNLGFGQTNTKHHVELPETYHAFPEEDLTIQGAPVANAFFQQTLDPLGGFELDEDLLDRGPGLSYVHDNVHEHSSGLAGPESVRGRPRGRGRGRGRRSWKWALVGTTHDAAKAKAEARIQQKSAQGRGRGRGQNGGRGEGEPKRGRRSGPRKPVDPGKEFKGLQTQAISALMEGKLDDALSSAQLAVQTNPEVRSAHTLLSEILEKLHRKADSVGALMTGAVVAKDSSLWIESAERTISVLRHELSWSEVADQALYCYSMSANLQKRMGIEDRELQATIRRGMRDMLIAVGRNAKARHECSFLSWLNPGDFENAETYAQLCLRETDDIPKAKEAYEKAFEARKTEFAGLDDKEREALWSHLDLYAQLVDRHGTTRDDGLRKLSVFQDGLRKVKRFARYILGRADESFWEKHEGDDKEFDIDHGERRVFVGEFQQGKASRDKALFGQGLPLDLRIKLGIFRVKMGMSHHEEAMRHLNHLLAFTNEMADHVDLFDIVSETLKDHLMYDYALQFYEPMLPHLQGTHEVVSLGLAQAYIGTGRYEDAEDTLRALIRADPLNKQGRVDLAKMFVRQGWKEEALPLCEELIRLGHREVVKAHDLPLPPVQRRFHRLPKGANGAVEGAEERPTPLVSSDVDEVYQRAEHLWPSVEQDMDGEDAEEWLELAGGLAETFRQERAFFPLKERNPNVQPTRGRPRVRRDDSADDAGNQNSRLAAQTPTDFKGILLGDWHRILSNLALLWAARADYARSYEILYDILLKATIFYYDRIFFDMSNAVALCCALQFNDSHAIADIARNYITKSDARASIPFHLLAGGTRLCYGENNGFDFDPTQKFVIRSLKGIDYMVLPPELRQQIPHGSDLPTLETRLNRYGSETGQLDAGVLTLYANIMALAKHGGQSSLAYYLRALAIEPDNPSIILSLGLTYIHNAMKRVSENRQFGIQQGLSFVRRYYDMRLATNRVILRQEAEYNMAKVWHVLGLTHLAIPSYEKVVGMSAAVQEEARSEGHIGAHTTVQAEDFAMEAAFALQQIFALAGNVEAAATVTQDVLVI